MSKRYCHTIQPVGMGTNPNAIVCVQAAIRHEHASDADAWGQRELDGWNACVMTLQGPAYRTGPTIHGDTPDEFWKWLKANADTTACTWLMTIDTKEHAAILGLWDRITDRTAFVAGADPWTRLDDRDSAVKGRGGFVILEGPPTIIEFKLEDTPGSFVWIDPANYGADDLFHTAVRLAPISKHRSSVPEFCWLDAPTLPYQIEAVNDWVNAYMDALVSLGIGAMERTAASQAMAGFKRRYMRDRIEVHDNLPLLKIERAALFGGRCECNLIGTVYGNGQAGPIITDDSVPGPWRVTEGPIYHLDVNSLYPSVALNAKLPIKLVATLPTMTIDRLRKASETINCVARVYVETDVPCVPLRTANSVLYPVGKFWTTLSAPELRLVFKHGDILKCGVFAGYESSAIYTQWIDDLFCAKIAALSRGSATMADCIKRILNASFGKWAQRARKWQSMPDELCMLPFSQWWQINPETDQPEQWRSLAWAVERCVDCGEPGESSPIITATIHALGRARLWELMEFAGRHNVYYCDTDSIWCNHQGYLNLVRQEEVDSTALGKLKLVARHDTVTWWGQKRYSADGVLTVAGAPEGALQSGDAFADVLVSNPIHSYLFNDEQPGIDRINARVRLNIPYSAGSVGPDGSVEPPKILDPPEDRA